MITTELIQQWQQAFAQEPAAVPKISLRGGNARDNGEDPPPYDPVADAVLDAYLERYHWGISYLDAGSWRRYRPALIDYALRYFNVGSLVVNALLNSLCSPDRDPPRLASLNDAQQALITQFLDILAFTEGSAHQDLAGLVLEEWWAPDALYREQP